MDPSKVMTGILLSILITGFIILLLITVSSIISAFMMKPFVLVKSGLCFWAECHLRLF